MRVLLLLSETWNDKKHPNNNSTNWFFGMEGVEVYNISGGPGLPQNRCCKDYFQVSDREMAKSLLFGRRAGRIIRYENYPAESEETNSRVESFVYKNRKKFSFPLMRLARSFIWRFGRYDKKALGQFIREFNPDIIFSQRFGSVKMCRLEKMVLKYTDAPIVAYTGDDEYSLRQINFFPSYWIHRLWTRMWLRKLIPRYSIFYSQSDDQMKEFRKKFGIETKFLVKCGEFKEEKIHTSIGSPIRIVYAGKLYCNRWKTLALIVKALREINKGGIKAVLEIYTADTVDKKMKRALDDGEGSFIKGCVGAEELREIYNSSDIVLHVEGLDLANRLLTRYSFSTKVMDCLSSGAATMAVCWEKHAAYVYLKENDVALTASSYEEVLTTLSRVVKEPDLVLKYARRAYEFGVKNHDRKYIQHSLLADFERVINKNKKEKV